MSKIVILAISALCVFISSCAEIEPFKVPEEVLKHPLGTDPIRRGMTKDEINGLWGPPDQVNKLGASDEWGTMEEEWVYLARYGDLPIDKSYLTKTKYLYFQGNILTSFGNEPKSKNLP